MKDTDKPLVVSGILLALRESEFKNFSITDLTGDDIKTDGQKIYDAISANLQRSKVAPDVITSYSIHYTKLYENSPPITSS